MRDLFVPSRVQQSSFVHGYLILPSDRVFAGVRHSAQTRHDCRPAAASLEIDPHAILTGLRRTVAESARTRDQYLWACSAARLCADLALAAAASAQPSETIEAARKAAAEIEQLTLPAADALIAGEAIATGTVSFPHLSFQGDLEPWQELIDVALLAPLPEAFGYDLGDPELCIDDARWFAAHHVSDAALLVIGIRSGGSFLAPIWA